MTVGPAAAKLDPQRSELSRQELDRDEREI